ncbi:MAG: hypothetical protein K8R46_11355 [Pirellulales bacterium]|nr:hypothetical protein [Pirellulales bacterium]
MPAVDCPPPDAIAVERRPATASERTHCALDSISISSLNWNVFQDAAFTAEAQIMQDDCNFARQVLSRSSVEERVRQYVEDINNMWEPYIMTEEEVAYFQAERSAPFVPFSPDQIRSLPIRKRR